MSKNSYKAQLNYYDSKWGWKSEGTASQGQWDGTGVRTGVLYFPGLAALKGKIINSVKLTATTGQTGYGTATTKTVYIYNSASQGGIKTSLNAGHRTGNALGSCKAPMWDNTKTFDVAFMAASIAAGYDTYCIYNGSSYTDYLKWTAVTLEVDWQEPATQPSLSASTVEMGKSVTINTPAVNSAYRHNIWAAFGNAGVVIAERVVSSTTWTPDVNLASQISNATSGVATIYCDTFDANGTQLGTKTISITLTVPGSVVPSAGTLSAALAEDTSGTGLYVKGMGKAKLTLSGASGAYGSSITSYTITGGGWTTTNSALTTGTLASAGNITFTATVTDSRGRKASTTRTISVIDYTKPGVAVCDVYRCDADGNRKKAGTYFAVEINASYSAITGNTLSITARYKKQSESSYGTAANVTNNGKTVIGGGNIGASTTYDVLVTVADKYNSLSIPRTLSTKSVLQSFKRSAGAAIGKVAELANWLDVAWNTRIRGNLKVDGGISDGAWNRDATDLMLINFSGDDPYNSNTNYDNVVRTEDASTLINSPVTSGPFYAYRKVYPVYTPWSHHSKVFVELKEVFPQKGRIWTQAYDPNNGWSGHWSYSFTNNDVVPIANGGTGATNRGDALYNFIVGGVYSGNLNDLAIIGTYWINLSNCQNGPSGSGWGTMEVTRSTTSNYLQRFTFYMGMTYYRTFTNGRWYDWRALPNAHTAETLWEGSLKNGTATIANGAKYAYLIVGGWVGSNEDAVTQIIPVGWGTHMRLTSADKWLAYQCDSSGSNASLTILSNPSGGSIAWVWGVCRYKE